MTGQRDGILTGQRAEATRGPGLDPLALASALVLEDGRTWGEACADWQRIDADAVLDRSPGAPRRHYLLRGRANVRQVTPRALNSWMQQWPWFLVLDGLDEVTEPMVRKRLIRHITEFVSDAEADDCDLLVVVTTRPTGYMENIAPSLFERVDLSLLEVAQAVQYGALVTRVRLGTDLDKIERIETQLRRAAETESLRRLMKTLGLYVASASGVRISMEMPWRCNRG